MIETWQQIVLWFLAIVMVVAALGVVTARNVVHSALYLVATLLGAASLYVLLYAEFIAWTQVLIYVGAIIVLLLFGIMLTRAPIGRQSFDNDQRPVAAICAGVMFAVTAWILVDAFAGEEIDFTRIEGTSTSDLGQLFFSKYILPFEAAGVLLLAAVVGAVVIARRD